MSQTTSLTIIAICQIVYAVIGLLVVAAIFWAVSAIKSMINKKVDEALDRIQPVVDQAKSIAEQAKETAEKVSDKVDSIVTRAESTVDRVSDKVESMSTRVEGTVGRVGSKVEDAVNPQVVTVAGLVGTAVRVAQIYKDIISIRQSGNGSDRRAETGQSTEYSGRYADD